MQEIDAKELQDRAYRLRRDILELQVQMEFLHGKNHSQTLLLVDAHTHAVCSQLSLSEFVKHIDKGLNLG